MNQSPSCLYNKTVVFVFCSIISILFPDILFSQSNTFPSSGNVGIGTIYPQSNLQINGDLFITGSNYCDIRMTGDAGYYGIGISSTPSGGGGWARRYGFYKKSDNSLLGGFGAMGGENSLNYLWIGRDYNDHSIESYLDGATYLKFDNATKLETTTTGATVTGILNATNGVQVNGTSVLTTLTGLQYQLWYPLNDPLNGGNIGNKFGWTNQNAPGTYGFGGYLSFGPANDNYGAQIYIDYYTPDFWFRQINNGTTAGWMKLANTVSPTFTGTIITQSDGIFHQDTGGQLVIKGASDSNKSLRIGYDTYSNYGWMQGIIVGTSSSPIVLQPWGGNVGIGIISPGSYKLNVAGKIRADEIVVNTAGADFVFDPEYLLPELFETEKFIKDNQRLPGFPSSSEMMEKGMNVSETQTLLLQKIEELTLYIIQQNKEIELLKSVIKQTHEYEK